MINNSTFMINENIFFSFRDIVCWILYICIAELYVHIVFVWTDIDECLSDPCDLGGTCVNAQGRFICLCPDGATGTQCKQGMWAWYIIWDIIVPCFE